MKRYTFNVGTGYDKNGNPISIKRKLLNLPTIRALLAHTFGGYTETSVTGGWVNGEGELVEEEGKQFTTVTDEPKEKAYEIARRMADLFNQESVMLSIEPITNRAFVTVEGVTWHAR